MYKKTGWAAREWSIQEENKIIELYNTKKSYKEISQILKRTINACKQKISKLGLGGKFKFTCNEKFFNTNTLLSSYWAGFIAADGWVINKPKKYQLGIALNIKDINHLERYKADIEYSGDIKKYISKYCRFPNGTIKQNYNYASVTICNKKLVKSLIESDFNIIPNKSLKLEPPNIDGNHALSFIKGYIDGDGTIYIDKYNRIQCSIVGTKQMLEWIKFNFDIIYPTKYMSKVLTRKDRNPMTCQYKISGLRALSILEHLCNIQTPELYRKWNNIRSYNFKT